MEIRVKKKCSLIKETMEFLFFAVNMTESTSRKFTSHIKKLEEEMKEGLAFQKELMEMAKALTVTEPMKKYFERFGEEELLCLASAMVSTFEGEESDDVEAMERKTLEEFRKYSTEAFPVLRKGDSRLRLGKERCRLITSVKSLEIEEKFQARLLFAFEDFEQSLKELGEILKETMPLMLPYKERLEAEAERMTEEWKAYFEKNGLKEFSECTGVYIDEKQYSYLEIIPNLVNGAFLVVYVDDGVELLEGIKMEIGFLVNEKVLRAWNYRRGQRALEMLADSTKLDILLFIRNTPHYGKEIAERFGLTTATISYHMGELLNEGLIDIRQEGKRIYYSLNKEKISEVLEHVRDMLL